MGAKLPSVETVFGEAMEIAAPAERAAFLDRACGGDATLRRQVESLLDAHARAGGFLEPPAEAPTITLAARPPAEGPGAAIGPYRLLEEIGEGGMGVVYMAEQVQPVRRRVALKIIRPGMDSRQVVARFEAERQALALMDHPNIARVHDAGATASGRPYFVMELVRGRPITEYCDREGLTVPQRLELFVLVCRAVQHAHQKGIIHRDIKPSNVLVTVVDGVPTPKVIDFGVAKATGASLTDHSLFTGFHQMVGTPLYMSPEQADLSSADVDTRSDIYSLGVLLYELLTGSTPFDRDAFAKAAFDEMRRMLREDEPPTPSKRLSSLGQTLSTVSARRGSDPRRLDRAVRGGLDWVVMKALEKDRRRRYETANDFAADVTRYLTDHPVEACPPSTWYRLRKYARRNRAGLVTAALVAAAMSLGTAASLWQAMRATRAEQEALSDRKRAEASDRAARVEAARVREINTFLTEDLLRQADPARNAFEEKVSLLDVVDRAADKVGTRFRDRPEAEGALRTALSGIYRGLGSYEKAERQARIALEIAERLHGAEAPESFRALGQLGSMRDELGRSREAIGLLERASEGLRRALGPDHLDTLAAEGDLAAAYHRADRVTDAIRLDEEGLKRITALRGADHPDALATRHNLAEHYRVAGRLAEAVRLGEAVLPLRESKLGPDHPDTLATRDNLALAYLDTGRITEALALHQKTLHRREGKLGPDHPETLTSRNNLAVVLLDAGRTAEAIELFRVTLQQLTPKLGPDHRFTLLTAGSLARAYNAVGRTGEAIDLLESVLKRQEATLGPDHPDTLETRSKLAYSYYSAGRNAEAIPLFEAVLRLRESKLGPDHFLTLVSRGSLAGIYGVTGRSSEAIALGEQTLKLSEAALGPDHPDTLYCRHNLAVAYLNAGRADEAIRLGEATLKLRESKLGPDHPGTSDSRRQLALAYARVGRMDEAEPLFRLVVVACRKRHEGGAKLAGHLAECGQHLLKQEKWADAEPLLRESLAIREKAMPDDWRRFQTMSLLGGALLGRREYAEAEPLLVQGYEGIKLRESKIQDQNLGILPAAVDRVVALYEAWGRPEEAGRWRARVGRAPVDLPADVFAK